MTMDAVASRAGLGAEEVDDVRQRAGRQVVHTDSDDAETYWATRHNLLASRRTALESNSGGRSPRISPDTPD